MYDGCENLDFVLLQTFLFVKHRTTDWPSLVVIMSVMQTLPLVLLDRASKSCDLFLHMPCAILPGRRRRNLCKLCHSFNTLFSFYCFRRLLYVAFWNFLILKLVSNVFIEIKLHTKRYTYINRQSHMKRIFIISLSKTNFKRDIYADFICSCTRSTKASVF